MLNFMQMTREDSKKNDVNFPRNTYKVLIREDFFQHLLSLPSEPQTNILRNETPVS